jgi:hypothetical protein
VGTLTFNDGRCGNVVLVGARENPKGAVVVVPGEEGGAPGTLLFADAVSFLYPQQIVELLCMQERAFGAHHLPSPAEMDA